MDGSYPNDKSQKFHGLRVFYSCHNPEAYERTKDAVALNASSLESNAIFEIINRRSSYPHPPGSFSTERSDLPKWERRTSTEYCTSIPMSCIVLLAHLASQFTCSTPHTLPRGANTIAICTWARFACSTSSLARFGCRSQIHFGCQPPLTSSMSE